MKALRGTKIYSILTGTCPVCQNESMYSERNLYKISSTLKIKERCGHCTTRYKIEPSFFFGAMYVSYPVGLIFAGITLALSYLVLGLTLRTTYAIIVVVMLLMLPVILRISRNIWINIFMKYHKPKMV